VVKVVADVMSATASTAVSIMTHAKAMTTCEGVMPLCVTMLVPNSDIADVAGASAAAFITGGQEEVTEIGTVGSSANIDGQHSSSKRKASDHNKGFCLHTKRRTSCGGDDADPAPILVQHISPSVSDAVQVRGSCCQTAARLKQLSELANRVSCLSQSQPPELAVRPSSQTRPSQSPVQVSCLNSLSKSAACHLWPHTMS
jgi:hypothetical protein